MRLRFHLALLICGYAASLPALTVTNAPARGVWCSDFDAVTNAARTAGVPVVAWFANSNCPYCDRLRQGVERSKAFGVWQRARGLYMVYSEKDKNLEGFRFVMRTPKLLINAPCVGIYKWNEKGGLDVAVNFTARRGEMHVRKGSTIAEQLMNSVDAALAGYLKTSGGEELAKLRSKAAARICVTNLCEGKASGEVSMSPSTGLLLEGGTVNLVARSGEGSTLAGWIDPAGRLFGGPSRLAVNSQMPEGLYKAVFRLKEDCKAPKLQLPTNIVTMTVGNLSEFEVPVNPEARPVAFKFTGLPDDLGLTKTPLNGVVGGVPAETGDYEVQVKSWSLVHPEWVSEGVLKIKVVPHGPHKDGEPGDAHE